MRPDRKGPRQCSRGPSKCANESRFYLQMGTLIHGTAKTAPLDKQMLATLQNITVHPLFRIAAWLYAINYCLLYHALKYFSSVALTCFAWRQRYTEAVERGRSMRGVVYVDILFLVNAVIGLFLLRCTARLAGREYRAWRMALGGMMAGAASLALLLPPLPAILMWGMKAAEACLIVLAAFPPGGLRCFFKTLWWYAALNVLLSGVVFAALYYGVAGGIEVNNMALYFNVPPLLLIAAWRAYIALCAWWTCALEGHSAHSMCRFPPGLAAPCVRGLALLDTGCSVRDPVSGQEAFLLSLPMVKPALPPQLGAQLQAFLEQGQLSSAPYALRLVPTQTALGTRALPAVTAQWLTLGEKGEKTVHNALAVFTPERFADGAFSAIVSPALRGG